jgi:hypothetical protein
LKIKILYQESCFKSLSVNIFVRAGIAPDLTLSARLSFC